MIYLGLSIFSSSIIFVIFKLFAKFQIDTLQALVVNYFTALICGLSLYGHEINESTWSNLIWLPFAAACSVLFIGLFFVMANSSQKNGVASTSVAVKMSMAVSLLLMIIAYKENLPILKILGIALAFIGVYLVSSSKSAQKNHAGWMLIVLFLGSGALDFILNIVMNKYLGSLTPSIFAAFGFGFAGIIGIIVLTGKYIRTKSTFKLKNVVAGLILGIPNFFSIYFLMVSYKSTGWDNTTVLAVTNVSVVVFSSLIGFIAFKESAGIKKLIGLACALAAIISLYIVNQMN